MTHIVRKPASSPISEWPTLPFDPDHLEQSIGERFEFVVRQVPQQTAIVNGSQSVTYEELNQAINRVAHALLARFGDERHQIGLLMENGIPGIITLLGIIKAGKIAVPVDPQYPQERISGIFVDAEISGLLTDAAEEALARAASGADIPLLLVEEIDDRFSEENPVASSSADDLALLFYTSGSTGRPKGVCRPHRLTVLSVAEARRAYTIGMRDRYPLTQSFSYGGAATPIFHSLLNGATLCMYDLRRNGLVDLVDWLAETGITIFMTVPTVLRNMVALMNNQVLLPDLRYLLVTGEPLTRRDVDLFRKHFPPTCLLCNRFGSIEIAGGTKITIAPDMEIRTRIVPVGFPADFTNILILDNDLNEVPQGMPGQIAVQRSFSMPGYWRNEELNRQKFLPDPRHPGGQIFLTGDIGLINEEGMLEYHGREDFIVKVKGMRVELAEIETALFELPNVKDSAVIAVQDSSDQTRLAAYIVPEHMPGPTARSIREELSRLLPEYAIPHSVTILDALPRTTSGKVDRTMLPEPESNTRSQHQLYAAPRTSLERRLVDIWQEVLGVEKIGIDDPFLSLGGDSLSAMQVFTRIDQQLGKRLPFDVRTRASTIAELAVAIQTEDTSPPWPSLVPLQSNGSRPPLYCVHGVGGHVMIYYLFARGLGPDQPVYGLRARGIDGVTPPYISIEEMAAHYVREIRAFQPEGPYYLSGFSLGGKIAFEMARQLQEQGVQVALVAIFDTTVTPRLDGDTSELDSPEQDVQPAAEERAAKHWQELRQRSPLAAIGYLARLIGRLWHWQIVKRLERMRSRPSEVYDPSISPERRVKIASFAAAQRYKFKPYEGSIVLFRSEDMKVHRADPRPVWQQWVSGSVDLIDIPGDHETMLRDPHVTVFASKMTALLASVQSYQPPSP